MVTILCFDSSFKFVFNNIEARRFLRIEDFFFFYYIGPSLNLFDCPEAGINLFTETGERRYLTIWKAPWLLVVPRLYGTR